MHPDLDRLIRLQKLDTAADEARRLIAAFPQRVEGLDALLGNARTALAAAREQKARNEAERRALEKDLAAVKTRRSRYTDQTMEVKTNREYHALQAEILMADEEIKRLEDRILENMLGADEIGASIKAAETAHKEAEHSIAAQKRALEEERCAAEASLEGIAGERRTLVSEIAPAALQLFEVLSRGRRSPAVAEVRDGLCSVCHVRVRPQIYQEAKRNTHIVQCESCQRILYYVPPPAAGAGTPA